MFQNHPIENHFVQIDLVAADNPRLLVLVENVKQEKLANALGQASSGLGDAHKWRIAIRGQIVV